MLFLLLPEQSSTIPTCNAHHPDLKSTTVRLRPSSGMKSSAERAPPFSVRFERVEDLPSNQRLTHCRPIKREN